MSTSAARRNRRSFICGPLDDGCWMYGTRVADEHLWEDDDNPGPTPQGGEPLCVVCGLPRSTFEREQAAEADRRAP